MASLVEIAQLHSSGNPVTKPLRYYQIYEQELREEGLDPISILEIGVYEGESTKIFSMRYPFAHIVALDLTLKDIDFSDHSNVSYLQCDQTDKAKLKAIIEEHFPTGLDLVIDDASHLGHLSKLTFDCVFPYLRSGGLYIVEDWGTGYMGAWLDGKRFTDCEVPSTSTIIAKRVRSHDHGMVGFVKSLVDYTAMGDINSAGSSRPGFISQLILSVARFRPLTNIVNRFPHLKARLIKYVQPRGERGASKISPTSMQSPELKSVKFFRGLCIACKA